MGIAAREAEGGAAPAAPPGQSDLLEYSQNVVTAPALRTFELARCGCDCWYCGDCCKRKGYNLRAELVPVLKTFTGLMMITLTVDPSLFPSPRDAYLYVRGERAISKLMQDLDRTGHLHSRRYFYIVEFQRNTEQAHFHVLVDATFIPKDAIDRAWSKFRPLEAGAPDPGRPAFGMTRFSAPRFEGGAVHAARYATKYLVKVPEHGWPTWVLEMGADARVPRYGTSRGFWGRACQPTTPSGKTRAATARSYDERIAACGTACNLFELQERVDPATGEAAGAREWRSRIEADGALIEIVAGDDRPGVRRTVLLASGVRACIEALERAAGRPIEVLSGLGAGGRADA